MNIHMKKKRIISYIFLALLMAELAVSLLSVAPASAQLTGLVGEWIDKVNIKINGQLFRDADPFDGTDNYKFNVGANCDSSLNVKSLSSSGTGGNVQFKKINSIGECIDDGPNQPISFLSPERRSITAYRTSDDTIFLPAYKFSPDSSFKDFVNKENGFFKNLPKDALNYKADTFPIFIDGNWITDGNNSRVVASTKKLHATFCNNVNVCRTQSFDINFAANGAITQPDANAYGQALTDGGGKTTQGGTDAKKDDSCESRSGVLGWIMCPVVKSLDAGMNWLDTQIQALLEVDKTAYDNPQLYSAWTKIRNIAYVILIPIMLVMVIATAMGSELFSAYTVKKSLPRMGAAIIFITLSYFICTFLIGLSNVVGEGTLGILTSPFSGAGAVTLSSLFGPSGALGFILGLVQGVGAAIGVIIILWLFGGTIFLFIGLAFFVLLLRQVFVVALMLAAPLAILAWIFPGNDKLWKTWWSGFSKLLLMFPLIMALIAVGRDMASVVHTASAGGLQGTFIKPVATLALYALPYAFIPFTFKFAGGAFATLSGMANDKGKGLFDRQRKGRAAKLERTGQGNLFKGKTTGARGLLNRRAEDIMHAKEAGINPLAWKAKSAAARSARISEMSAKGAENRSVQSVIKNDDLLQASLHGNMSSASSREYLSNLGQHGDELEQNVASIDQARKAIGGEAFNDLAASANAGTGTGYGDGPAEMLATINRVAGGDRARFSRVLASARGNAERARRGDLYGAGFSASNQQGQAMFNAGAQDDTNAAWQGANEVLTDAALRTKSAGELASGRHNGLLNLMPAIERRLDNSTNEVQAAHASGDQPRIVIAEREHKRILAHSMAMHDIAGQVSEENSQLIGERILGRDTVADAVIETQVGTDVATRAPIMQRRVEKVRTTVLQAVDGRRREDPANLEVEIVPSMRGDEDFARFRKDYAQPTSAAAALAAAGAVGPPGGPPGGIPPIPGAPLPTPHP